MDVQFSRVKMRPSFGSAARTVARPPGPLTVQPSSPSNSSSGWATWTCSPALQPGTAAAAVVIGSLVMMVLMVVSSRRFTRSEAGRSVLGARVVRDLELVRVVARVALAAQHGLDAVAVHVLAARHLGDGELPDEPERDVLVVARRGDALDHVDDGVEPSGVGERHLDVDVTRLGLLLAAPCRESDLADDRLVPLAPLLLLRLLREQVQEGVDPPLVRRLLGLGHLAGDLRPSGGVLDLQRPLWRRASARVRLLEADHMTARVVGRRPRVGRVPPHRPGAVPRTGVRRHGEHPDAVASLVPGGRDDLDGMDDRAPVTVRGPEHRWQVLVQLDDEPEATSVGPHELAFLAH